MVKEITNTEVIYVSDPIAVFFVKGSSKLTDLEKVHLREAVRRIKAKGEGLKFTLRGSADAGTGTPEINEKLSRERAEAVISYLKELGITSDRFSVSTTIGDDQDAELDRCVIIEKQ